MNHTVLHKTAWNTDQWTVLGTFSSNEDAQDAIDSQPDEEKNNMRGDFYYTCIKRHRKSISSMTNWENAVVSFSDGTKAIASDI